MDGEQNRSTHSQADSHLHQQNTSAPFKVPPHMRRLGGVQVSSPSDNLSPCSQKLMAADLCKGTKPRSFNSLLKHSTGSQGGHSQLATGDSMEIDESSKVIEADEETAELPPSPTRNFGGLTSL